jgi:hypothetical protein
VIRRGDLVKAKPARKRPTHMKLALSIGSSRAGRPNGENRHAPSRKAASYVRLRCFAPCYN